MKNQQPHFSLRSWIEIFPEAKDCLVLKKKSLAQKGLKLQSLIEYLLPKAQTWFGVEIVRTFFGEDLDRILKEIKKINLALNPPTQKSELTNWQIDVARNYPISQLIETNKRGFALCPFHKEGTASFYTRKFGYCFACGWSGNAVDFLMKRDNMSFIEAVKFLCN